MSESKSTCYWCKRPPGGIHKESCARGRRFRRAVSWYDVHPWKAGYPIADITDLVMGPISVRPIPPGEREHLLC